MSKIKMGKIELQKGDYVVHDKMTLEQYERFHEESLNQGYESYDDRTAKERYGNSDWEITVLYYDDFILGSPTNPSLLKRDVTEYFTQEQQQEPTDSTMSMNIYTSIDTVTMDGNHVSYSFELDDADNCILTWMTALDEYIGLLKQAGYIIDKDNLLEYAQSKHVSTPESNCGGHF